MLINSYATLQEFKNFKTQRGQSAINTDAADDLIIGSILESVSRYIDDRTNRKFYPKVETRYFSVPENQNDDSLLFVDDLLEITSLANGDTTAILSTSYNLLPKNAYPKYGIKLIPTSNIYWTNDSTGNNEFVIPVTGVWDFHNDYSQRAWQSVGTLGVDLNISALSATLTAGHSVLTDMLVKIGTEMMLVSVSTNTMTILDRGENGSTASAHSSGSVVYAWIPQPEIKSAVLLIAANMYSARAGQVANGKVTVTNAGVVIKPEDIPTIAQQTIQSFARPL